MSAGGGWAPAPSRGWARLGEWLISPRVDVRDDSVTVRSPGLLGVIGGCLVAVGVVAFVVPSDDPGTTIGNLTWLLLVGGAGIAFILGSRARWLFADARGIRALRALPRFGAPTWFVVIPWPDVVALDVFGSEHRSWINARVGIAVRRKGRSAALVEPGGWRSYDLASDLRSITRRVAQLAERLGEGPIGWAQDLAYQDASGDRHRVQ